MRKYPEKAKERKKAIARSEGINRNQALLCIDQTCCSWRDNKSSFHTDRVEKSNHIVNLTCFLFFSTRNWLTDEQKSISYKKGPRTREITDNESSLEEMINVLPEKEYVTKRRKE